MERKRARWTIVACLALVLAVVPALGYGQSAEEWLSMGRNETDPQTQIDYFTRAIRLNPDLAEAYAYRGTAYSELGKYDQAVVDYSRAVSLNPDNAQTYHNRGYAYEKLGQYEKAVADFTRAIRIEPHYGSAYNSRGVAYYKLGMTDEALSDFDKACKYGYSKGCENYYMIKQ